MGVNPDDYVFTFGKHEGEHIKDVPPSYVNWCLNNIDWFDFEEPYVGQRYRKQQAPPPEPEPESIQMAREDFLLIRKMLHPDHNPHPRAADAFHAFTKAIKSK